VFDDRPDWPSHPVRAGPFKPRRWGYYPSHATAGDEVPSDVEYRYDTVEAATTGALEYLRPYWNDGSALVIHNGVRVSNMPDNAVVTGSPGYRARIDAGLYDLGQEQLQHIHSQTENQVRAQTRLNAINYEIPLGQQVHAFCLIWEKLPRRSRPRMHDFLDEMMPRMSKRTRQRHLRAFLIVSSEDWRVILSSTEVEITGMASILEAARIYAEATMPKRRKKTPIKQRYTELRNLVYTRRYEDARRLVLRFDAEDDPEGAAVDEDTQ
jgi:hypothetical protein